MVEVNNPIQIWWLILISKNLCLKGHQVGHFTLQRSHLKITIIKDFPVLGLHPNMVDICNVEEEKGRNHDMGDVEVTWISYSTYINVTKSHVARHLKVLFTCIENTISIKDDL
jgi:hypothetical protein